MITVKDAVSRYIQSLCASGYSEFTTISATSILGQFATYADGAALADVGDRAIAWLALRRRQVRRNTLCANSSHVKQFLKFCKDNGWIESNPVADMKRPCAEQVVTQPLSDREILALCEAATGWQRTAIVLLLGTGMRIGELAALRWQDIYDQYVVVHGKGSKQRTLAPGRRAMEMLRELPQAGDKVFPCTYGGIKTVLRRLSVRSGIYFHPHQFRHTFSHRFLEAGGSFEELSEILGHANLNTTAVYVRAFRRDRALAAQRRWNPADALFGIPDDGDDGASNVVAFHPRVAVGAR